MKKIFGIMSVVVAAFALSACTTDLDDVSINPQNVKLPELTLPEMLDLGAADETIEFDCTQIDYGFTAAVKNKLVIKGSDKEASMDITIENSKIKVARYTLNNVLVNSGFVAGEGNDVTMSVAAYIINDKGSIIPSTGYASEEKATKVIPYVWSILAGANYSDMKEVSAGKWTFEKYSNDAPFKFAYNHATAVTYGGTIAEFKVAFDVTKGGADIDVTTVADYAAGSMYNVEFDLNAGTAMVYVPDATWALIGVGGNWNKDIDMVEEVDGVWISPLTEIEGEFKLRYGGGWDMNYGGAVTELGTPFEGIAGGDNISVPAGVYQVVLYGDVEGKPMININRNDGWSLIGGGVMGNTNWTADYLMTKLANGKFVARNVYLSGDFKIRKDLSWDETDRGGKFGELDTPFAVEHQGANINVGPKNWYDVIYDPAAETITVSKGIGYIDGVDVEYPEEIGLTGDFSGYNWSPEAAPTYDCGKYTGVSKGIISMVNTTYGFKVTYGSTWVSGALQSNADGVYTFALFEGDNMSLPDGAYGFEINLAEKTAVFTTLAVGLRGTINGWGWPNIPMEVDANGIYHITQTFVAGDMFKFCFDEGWTYNLGGTVEGGLTMGGPDINVAEAGDYDITLDIVHTPYSFTMVKK